MQKAFREKMQLNTHLSSTFMHDDDGDAQQQVVGSFSVLNVS